MMGRGLWFVAGAAAGVYGMVRVRRIAEALTVDGLRDRVGAAVVGARMFGEEVAQGAAEAETQLRERYEIAAGERRELAARGTGDIAATGTTGDRTLGGGNPDGHR
jgi:hypothetical protein